MSKHTRENLIFDARKRFEVFDRRGGKDAAEFAINFFMQQNHERERILLRKYHTSNEFDKGWLSCHSSGNNLVS